MKLSFEQERNGKLFFLDMEVSREGNKFVTTVYRNPIVSGFYIHFDSFLPSTYIFSLIYTLTFRCFLICLDWTNFHNEWSFLKDKFLRNRYPASSVDKCVKIFLNKIYLKRHQILTVEKKFLTLVLPHLGELSLHTRAKLHKALKRTLCCCIISIFFKSQRNLSNVFRFKDRLPYDLVSRVVYKFECERWDSFYYSETARH